MNFANFDPIFPVLKTLLEMEFSSEYTGTLLCYIFGPSMVKYGILPSYDYFRYNGA